MDAAEQPESRSHALLRFTTAIIAGLVAGNRGLDPQRLASLIGEVHATLDALGRAPPAAPPRPRKPAVPISRSVHEDYIVCLEDGARLKMLKRYLRARHGLEADEYRRKWGLPADYPMVAPSYAARRSEFAKRIGLGRRGAAPR